MRWGEWEGSQCRDMSGEGQAPTGQMTRTDSKCGGAGRETNTKTAGNKSRS